MIKDRIYKTEKVRWQNIRDLQPENLKVHYNISYLRSSILKYGIAKAYDVCELDGELYWLDGHTRTDMLRTLQSEGIDIPELLTANFCTVKDKKEAVQILLDVHNQRNNPIDVEEMEVWVQELGVEEINIESLNTEYVGDRDDNIQGKGVAAENDENSKTITLEYTIGEYDEVMNAFANYQGSKEYVIYNLLVGDKKEDNNHEA